MGKNQKRGDLGRLLVKDRKLKKNAHKSSQRHTSYLQDGQDYNRIDFNSITEQSDIDSFLTTAELAGTEFKAEKLNVKFIRPTSVGIMSMNEKSEIKSIQEKNKEFLRIPRRPPWDRSMSAEELGEAERETFLEWRRSINQLEESKGLLMTPYEKNLQFWRQLWRVIERSDVVVQIVDARNPLLFYCEDLSQYVKEVSCSKENLILVNKADFLAEEQRLKWAKYFNEVGNKVVFFSAILEPLNDIEEEEEKDITNEDICNLNKEELNNDLCNLNIKNENESELHSSDTSDDDDEFYDCNDELPESNSDFQIMSDKKTELSNHSNHEQRNHFDFTNSSKILTIEELTDVFKSYCDIPKFNKYVTIGLVGYPNVGKSSTINRLLEQKKVSVSATPGKTKHFQTLFLSDEILLCDCPGLVFPAFVSSKEEMIISGILPVDQMRDHVLPMNLLLSIIPRHIMEGRYGVSIPPPPEGDDPHRSPTSEEFLSVYGYMRGYMTPRGIPDHPRSARYILKDFINGKLLSSSAPPSEPQDSYHQFTLDKIRKVPQELTPQQLSVLPRKKPSAAIDASFFNSNSSMVHFKGKRSLKPTNLSLQAGVTVEGVEKPWRLMSKRNTRQKARIQFAYLDQ